MKTRLAVSSFDLDANLNRFALNMALPRTLTLVGESAHDCPNFVAPYNGHTNDDVKVQSFCDASHFASASAVAGSGSGFSFGFLLFKTLGKPPRKP